MLIDFLERVLEGFILYGCWSKGVVDVYGSIII